MPSNTRASGASGIPSHLEAGGVGGVAEAARLPRPSVEQWPGTPIQGLNDTVNPLLQLAGAFYNRDGYLVREVIKHAGPPRLIGGRMRQPISRAERHVAQPGMAIEDARLRGLDFFSPQYGWIRGGLKIEREHPDNLGNGGIAPDLEYVDIEEPDTGSAEV